MATILTIFMEKVHQNINPDLFDISNINLLVNEVNLHLFYREITQKQISIQIF